MAHSIHLSLLLTFCLSGMVWCRASDNTEAQLKGLQNARTAEMCKLYCAKVPTCLKSTLRLNQCILTLSRNTKTAKKKISERASGNGNTLIYGLQFHSERKSWIEALEYCQSNNSSLVEISNESVQKAVNSLLTQNTEMPEGVWIGLERPIFGCNIKWVWTSGSEIGPLSYWNNTNPVDPFNNHCGKIIRVKTSQELKWLDENCLTTLPFICQSPTHDACTQDPK